MRIQYCSEISHMQIAEQSRPRKLIKNFGLTENFVLHISRCKKNLGILFMFFFKHSKLQNDENDVRFTTFFPYLTGAKCGVDMLFTGSLSFTTDFFLLHPEKKPGCC